MALSIIPTNVLAFANVVPRTLSRAPKGGKLATAGAPLRDLQDHVLHAIQHEAVLAPDVYGRILVNLQALLDECRVKGLTDAAARIESVGSVCIQIFGAHSATASRQGTLTRLAADLDRDGLKIWAFLDAACEGIEENQRRVDAAEAAAKAVAWASFTDTVRGATLILASAFPNKDSEVLESMAVAEVSAVWRKEGKPVPRRA